MNILISNDDGVMAPGIWVLVEALKDLGEITVVAPDREQSGASSSLTLHNPLRVTEMPPTGDVATFTVDGTPADSVIVGLGHVLNKKKVDLVISGINSGSNVGNDLLYSGTVAAAFQGYFWNIPSMAVSVTSVREPRFDVAASLARVLAPMMVKQRVFKDILLNVNVPSQPPEELTGIEVTRLAQTRFGFRTKKGDDGRREFVWITRKTRISKKDPDEGTDVWAIRNKKISLTPIWTDLTQQAALPQLTRVRAAARKAIELGPME